MICHCFYVCKGRERFYIMLKTAQLAFAAEPSLVESSRAKLPKAVFLIACLLVHRAVGNGARSGTIHTRMVGKGSVRRR